ncbi:acyl-CoA dehydrogenase family protein [Sphingomonas immobilis]|uniref:Acyl-CoA dehydrogenase family protein n=1 Tax=Sphingomonas immobilis TaxID=3063997 RepID=A0ABT9A0J2_9SPHN|nr:acyl-CoA dehydrogenase family protein [Sphingomonas sp. CA1-15]MDO7842212.1 acyl-CoA dehydrogenase family protein [Sphingomonas sp. CA1-15]
MTILYDEQQQAIADEAGRILAARTSGERLKQLLETTGAHDEAFWETCKEQGWTGIGIPEEDGGIGLGLIELGLVAEAIGAVAAGAPFLGTGFGAAQAILAHGDAETRAAWLPKLASGEAIGAIAFAEGADMIPAAPALRLTNGRLSGVKPAVAGGASADVAIVLASGEHGPVLALVALKQDGVSAQAFETFDNSRCTADLTFDGADAVTLGAADAAQAALDILSLQAVVTAHEQVGGASKMMNTARDYALTRQAFGQVIGGFQSVKHRIAEDYVLVELARANALQAAASQGTEAFARNAAAARLSATEAYDTVSRDSTQVHGGIGVTWESDLHLHQRRARSLAIEQGPTPFWEDILVDLLAGEPA